MSNEIVAGKFSPGPWNLHPLEDDGFEIHDRPPEWESVVLCTRYPTGDNREEFRANGLLIAAAPLLLAACQKALYLLKGREHDQFLRDAISKALGEQA